MSRESGFPVGKRADDPRSQPDGWTDKKRDQEDATTEEYVAKHSTQGYPLGGREKK